MQRVTGQTAGGKNQPRVLTFEFRGNEVYLYIHDPEEASGRDMLVSRTDLLRAIAEESARIEAGHAGGSRPG
jgi:hypothetical protein